MYVSSKSRSKHLRFQGKQPGLFNQAFPTAPTFRQSQIPTYHHSPFPMNNNFVNVPSIKTLWSMASVLFFSFAVHLFSGLGDYLYFAIKYHFNQAASQYRTLGPEVRATAVFVAAVFTYSSLTLLCRCLRQAFYAKLARLVNGRFAIIEERVKLFVTKDDDEARYTSQQQRITELSRRLEEFTAKEEVREALVTNEGHTTSTPQQHKDTWLELLKHTTDSTHTATENQPPPTPHTTNDLSQVLALTLNDMIKQHSKDQKPLYQTLSALNITIQNLQDHQSEATQSITQTLQTQQQESLALHKTISRCVRAHTGPSPLADELPRKRCAVREEHDLAGQKDVLLEHTRESFEGLVWMSGSGEY
ncbi:uncharacterized protein EKO05_0010607 [Ascochyta rabiei]|nr:uncharacterized protein EKO05_0010607 [Ascochyta rabiei]UPX20373.1 hypothetical protein EKO05_0010607 [Ascochyta rabiei]